MDVLSQTTHLLKTDFMNEKSAMFSLRDILISCSKLVEVWFTPIAHFVYSGNFCIYMTSFALIQI